MLNSVIHHPGPESVYLSCRPFQVTCVSNFRLVFPDCKFLAISLDRNCQPPASGAFPKRCPYPSKLEGKEKPLKYKCDALSAIVQGKLDHVRKKNRVRLTGSYASLRPTPLE